MKAEYSYDVKLDYKPGVSDPAKTFVAYSEIIKSFKRIDGLLGRSLSHGSTCKQTLEDIQIGSLTTKIKSLFEYPEDELMDEPQYAEEDVEDYFASGTAAIFGAMEDGEISTEAQVEGIQDEIEKIAEHHRINRSFAYSKPSASELLDVLKEVSESTGMLTENESISYLSKKLEISLPRNVTVDVEKIEDEMKKKIVTGKRELILKIKKVYLIGNAKWEFKHGKNTIDAKILDQSWLDRFHSKSVAIAPGDSLEVVVEITEEYDKYGNLISDNYSIEKVLNIIPGEIDEE